MNDELPRFSQSSNAVTVPENKGVGQSVFSYVATDSDDDSDLRYSVLRNHTKAYDENGEKLEDADVTAQGIDVSLWFFVIVFLMMRVKGLSDWTAAGPVCTTR